MTVVPIELADFAEEAAALERREIDLVGDVLAFVADVWGLVDRLAERIDPDENRYDRARESTGINRVVDGLWRLSLAIDGFESLHARNM